MDDIVKQALAKWPNVPHCTGWLLLDRRGAWRMRDEAAQAAHASGEPIRHTALIGFINRNYEADDAGQWFFQNGPQRVYVELAYTPFVARLALDEAQRHLTLTDQTGADFTPSAAYVDELGGVLFADTSTPPRVAVLHDHDLDLFTDHADLADDGASGTFRWRDDAPLTLEAVKREEVAGRFGFVASPAAASASASASANTPK